MHRRLGLAGGFEHGGPFWLEKGEVAHACSDLSSVTCCTSSSRERWVQAGKSTSAILRSGYHMELKTALVIGWIQYGAKAAHAVGHPTKPPKGGKARGRSEARWVAFSLRMSQPWSQRITAPCHSLSQLPRHVVAVGIGRARAGFPQQVLVEQLLQIALERAAVDIRKQTFEISDGEPARREQLSQHGRLARGQAVSPGDDIRPDRGGATRLH